MKLPKILLALTAFAATAAAYTPAADACTRVLYVGDSTLRIVGRTLDWKTPIPTNLYVYPRGIEKQGNVGEDAVHWTSRYGAVYAVGYDGGITEGMNEKGLVINGLFCKGTIYNNDKTEGRPPMSLAMFVGWLLDMNATTPEVVEELRRRDFTISGATFDGGTVSALHWGVTDAEGRSAIFEFVDGELNVYEMQDMLSMANDPTWPQMQAIISYWHGVGGQNMLPGTVKSPDRCVRGEYFTTHVKKTADADLGASIVRTIMMNVSVPYDYAIETEPNVSSTQWRSYSNVRDLRYYFDIVTNNGLYYIDLKKCDLRKGAPVMKIDNTKSRDYTGCANDHLFVSAPFTPMY
ncbi:MAG: linear amide C-N hydrolase [Clostridium sp.]|nr:linear amide C-N hydrolase [Clostridium sp.]